jgi:hypothetical protein
MHRALIALVLLVTACGGGSAAPETTTGPEASGPAPDAVVLSADLVGGCAMMGPNCSRYVVYGDGRVEGYRLGGVGSELVAETTVDRDAVAEFADVVSGTDLEALRSRLPAGTCMACVDGVDTTLVVHTGGGDVTFSSAEAEFDPSEPVFAALRPILDAAVAGIEIPVQTR